MGGGDVAEAAAGVRRPERGADEASTPWRELGLQAAATWGATRLALAVVTYFVIVFFNANSGHLVQSLLKAWLTWDGEWYYLISRYGYFARQSANFFPLYPLLSGALAAVLGHAEGPGGRLVRITQPQVDFDAVRITAMLVVSNLAALGAYAGVALVAWQEYRNRRVVALALLAMAAYPLAFYLATPFAQSILVALSAFALYFARRGLWLAAAATAFFAALDWPIAIVLEAPLVYEYGRQAGWWAIRSGSDLRAALAPARLLLGVVVGAAVPLGLGVYSLYLWWRFHDPLLYVHTQQTLWYHHFQPLWISIQQQLQYFSLHSNGSGPYVAMSLIDMGAAFGVLAIALIAGRSQPFAWTLFLLGLFVVTTFDPRFDIPNRFVSASRYMTAAIPAYVQLGRWGAERPGLASGVAVVSFLLQGALVSGYLVGIGRVQVF